MGVELLWKILAHPLTAGLDLDDPRTTDLRGKIIRGKSFLHQVYEEWYACIQNALPVGTRPVLELGSGGGFMGELVPGLIASDVFCCNGIQIVLKGQQLPFRSGSLRAVVMTDVLHHLPQPRALFAESARCIQSGGALVMIEPWVTRWSSWVYAKLHQEPFLPAASQWEFQSTGPLSGANDALAWIIFERDRFRFESEFPMWKVRRIKLLMPFRYLLSGGVSLRSLMPGCAFKLWRWIEDEMQPYMATWAMFALIVLSRT